ncbi:ubiquitin-protein ligase peroxin 10 ASCRUDRAFT_73340 [Ascoidea rubescens DSM 1968]|uniref:RING-type E3 ubiquitin transferase n=1 Tax=Ascoidea rubescens DSM 1968 TaxID=1344418 RepID=A0A1D2VPG0_9ASCO|nr:hypothetical protein ASCRUDRAFT_73340 [Ascoidea rubescens DSM 1968]ODV63498.1 hypothetical protein ASCRUDRAFT_73340 [Ascoidea rubescens DSM 1968]
MSALERIHRTLTFADAPSIVRAHQKDSFYENNLIQLLQDALKIVKNQRFIHLYSNEIVIFGKFLYLSLTTLVGSRTLGEEYVDLIYVTRKGKKLPRLFRRLSFILSYAILPYLLKHIAKTLAKRNDPPNYDVSNEKESANYLIKNCKSLSSFKIFFKLLSSKISYQNLLSFIMDSHLGFFYIFGSYYQLSKRVFGLRYALGHKKPISSNNGSYEILGGLIFIQSFFKSLNNILEFFSDYFKILSIKNVQITKSNQNQSQNSGSAHSNGSEYNHSDNIIYNLNSANDLYDSLKSDHDIDLSNPNVLPYIPTDSRLCMLCLSPMINPSSAPCGHLFCWTCILDWSKEQNNCPLCRTPIESKLIPLR